MLIVICKTKTEYFGDRPLTYDKEYEVLERLSSFGKNGIKIEEYLVMCDNNFECYYPTNLFITKREKSLNDLGI